MKSVRSQIGNAYIGLNNIDAALEEQMIAMEIRRDISDNSYKWAASLHKVAWLSIQGANREQGNYTDAEIMLRNSISVYNIAYKTRGELGGTSYLLAQCVGSSGSRTRGRGRQNVRSWDTTGNLGAEPLPR